MVAGGREGYAKLLDVCRFRTIKRKGSLSEGKVGLERQNQEISSGCECQEKLGAGTEGRFCR